MKVSITSILGLSLLISCTEVTAQKRPLDHQVYDQWESVAQTAVSRTGQYISYEIQAQEGDALFQLKDQSNHLLSTFPRATDAVFTKDESFLIARIKPTFAENRQAKIAKLKAEEMPKDTLLVLDIKQQKQWKVPALGSYQLASQKNDYLAFLTIDKNKEQRLHLRNLLSGDTLSFPKADHFAWSPNEDYLVFSKKNNGKDSLPSSDEGLYIYDLANKRLKKISSGRGHYKQLLFDDAGEQLAFLADKSPEKALSKDYKLYYYLPQLDSASVIASQQSAGIPERWQVSGHSKLKFSSDGQKLFFGLAPIPKIRDTSLVDFEHAQVDIWNWQDDYLQPQQLANLEQDKNRYYLSVIYPKQHNRLLSLLDETFNEAYLTDKANNEWVLATSDFGRRIAAQWNGYTRKDIYLVSTLSGQKRLVKENLHGRAYLSPQGDYVLYFDQEDSNWYTYNIASGKTVLLNDGLPVNFADEENDSPTEAYAYGLAAWSSNGQSVYLYDQFDIWKFDLAGKKKELLTQGEGRARHTVFRYIDLQAHESPREQYVLMPEKGTIFLSSFDKETKYSGVYTGNATRSRKPKMLFSGPYTYRGFKKAMDGETLLYSKENYTDAPDLYASTLFKQERRLTAINPQQQDYNWGTAELVHWTTPAGHEATGILYKPENFDPNKKYPIIAYFYERLSDGLYTYQAPAPTPSRLNIPYYVSNEYLVFAPDIRYEIGYPGKSAEEYVNSGMRYLAQHNWVDSTKMAIQGQSWGGYQVAHLITRTNMYAAAWAGAPVVNMTSAYGGIRWKSGMSRQFQYEHTQSRIGKSLWEDRERYIENSPLFFLDRVNTPVAIMSNDNDGAVPWYQGIEMFTALRRLQKPVWLLNYNGDEHNLMQRQNRKDIQRRQAQFFDHYLKGKAAPEWMSKGVPAKNKGIDWGF